MIDNHARKAKPQHHSIRGTGDAPGGTDGVEGEGGAIVNDDRVRADGDGRNLPEPDDHHDHRGHRDHDEGHHSHDRGTVRAAVVTVSSTRSLDEDASGDAIVEAFETAGHEITTRELVVDDLDGIQGRLDTLVRRDDVDVVVTTGGTGVTPDDVTVEAVRPLFEKSLPGFGELFRRRSEADIGTRIIATRATAGIADGVPVFCLPGSEAAVRLGVADIIVPEVGHLVGLARRDDLEE